MEYLSRAIIAATSNPDFNFHPKCEKIGLTHLSFANDIILFSRGDTPSIAILHHTLQQFGRSSGLELNLAKSQLFTAGILEAELHEMLQVTGFSEGIFPVRYLGTPLVYGKMKSCHYNQLVDKIANYFKAWSTHTLSYAGRLELWRQ